MVFLQHIGDWPVGPRETKILLQINGDNLKYRIYKPWIRTYDTKEIKFYVILLIDGYLEV